MGESERLGESNRLGESQTGQTSENRETGVTDGHREGGRETSINLEWLAPLKMKAT